MRILHKKNTKNNVKIGDIEKFYNKYLIIIIKMFNILIHFCSNNKLYVIIFQSYNLSSYILFFFMTSKNRFLYA